MPHRIDSHQHFWTLERDDYGWLTPELTALYRDFQPSDLAPLLGQAGVHRTVLVQAAPTLAETRYLLELAERHDFIAGVVGWVGMEGGQTSIDILEALQDNPLFLGVRPMIQDIADPAWMLRPSLAPALEAVAAFGLTFDALVKPVHLPNLLELLQRHPDLRTVIDHGAKPDIASGQWVPWARWIDRVAEETSACCKLSGLITEAGEGHSFPELAPYMDHLLDSFGAERLMWGSDWPVLNLRSDYPGWVTATRLWLAPLAAGDREAIEGGNAVRFYGLAGRGRRSAAAESRSGGTSRDQAPDSRVTLTDRPNSASSR